MTPQEKLEKMKSEIKRVRESVEYRDQKETENGDSDGDSDS